MYSPVRLIRRYSNPAWTVWRPVTSDTAIRDAPQALDVEEVPGVADPAGAALRADVDRRHERREAADPVLERVVDAERRVEDVAVLRDARVLEVEVADADLVQETRAERVRVREAAEPRGRFPERRGGRRIGPAEGFVHVLGRSGQRRAGLVRRPGAMLDRSEAGECPKLGRDDLLLEILPSECPVAAEHRLGRCRRGNQQFPVALRVQDVERHRMDVGGRQVAEDSRAGSA